MMCLKGRLAGKLVRLNSRLITIIYSQKNQTLYIHFREELDLSRAKGLVWIRKVISGLIRDSDLEKRVAGLEKRI